MFRTKDMYTVWDKLARNCIPCLGQSRPVAKIFYGRVRSYEETDQTRPEAQVSGGRGGGIPQGKQGEGKPAPLGQLQNATLLIQHQEESTNFQF